MINIQEGFVGEISLEENQNVIKSTEAKIRQIFQTMCQFGAMNYEKDLIENLIKEMKAGKISPDEAIKTSNQILNDKNGFLTMYR